MDNLLGDKITILRQRNKLSKKALAEMLHISVETLTKYEDNLIEKPDSNVIAAIATIFGITANQLLRDFDDYANGLPLEPLIKEKEDNAKEQNPRD